MKRKAFIILTVVLLAASCKPQNNSSRTTLDLVEEILSDRENPYRSLIPSSTDPKGDICILGSASSCRQLSELLETCDERENVDGSHKGDGLPDFAGETLSSVILPIDGNQRETAVRAVLATLDTVYHVSPYDLEGIGRRPAAKLIVLADTEMAENGKFDIDTLFAETSCGIEVISPFEAMLGKILDNRGHSADIGVICNPGAALGETHKTVAAVCAGKSGVPECRCSVFAAQDSADLLTSFFDSYIEAGGSKALDAVLIDSYGVDMDAVEESLSAVMDLSRPESMKYGRLLNPGFKVLDSGSVAAELCYDILRSRNAFTHKVSFPRAVSFTTATHPGREDGSIVLIPALNVQD